jgi:alpha-amylase/alpha-mannosidase (GH57 family)
MNRVHVVLLWHMHQPQYRDPETGRYVLPWTRLHALKDYWGMVRVLEEFPGVHATFNVVPALGVQLEEYASGNFREPWFDLAFRRAEELNGEEKAEILSRAFQLNHENLMARWSRFVELYEWSQPADGAQAVVSFTPREWRDLQVLSQLAWMDEEWLEKDPVVSRLASKGRDFSEGDQKELRSKQLELLRLVLPEYRKAAEQGQIEISTTPFYHPILPLLCDSDIARVANPATLLPPRAFRRPEDAGEQLRRAREYHRTVFGQEPAGLWPSEGSVSDQALSIAAGQGFRWFGTDEGVLGRTLNVAFPRDGESVPSNADRLYSPLRVQLGGREIVGLFRDHILSDLIGFVYGHMEPAAAAADLHGRLRHLGERVQTERPLTVSIFLDGENAWEYYRGNGREFLRQFYRRIAGDGDIRAVTASEAIAAADGSPSSGSIFPASWIDTNFNVWIGSAEDVQAWELLWEAREQYARASDAAARGVAGAPDQKSLAIAYESLLAAEGSDWCWWYGPEHSTPNDAEFDELYRKHLTGVYRGLGQEAPEALGEPIKRSPERALLLAPSEFLNVKVDGRDTSYFEWLGAGLCAPERRGTTMHGRTFYVRELLYGFGKDAFFLRVDPFPGCLEALDELEFRVTVRTTEEVSVIVQLMHGRLAEFSIERNHVCLLNSKDLVEVAFDQFLEIALRRESLNLQGRASFSVNVTLWHAGLPVDLLPAQGQLDVKLGEENFAWPVVA